MTALANTLNLLDDLVQKARKLGADAADALAADGTSVSACWRLGALERMERSEGSDLGLRVLIGKRQAIVSTSDRSPRALQELAERAVAMARAVPEDPYCGLADPSQLARDFPKLDLCDSAEPDADSVIASLRLAEEAARAVPGITNSEGAEGGWGKTRVALCASNGFSHAYETSGHSLSVSVLAGGGDQGMERDYEYSSAVYLADLDKPEDIGRKAGERTVRRLGARKMPTAKVPVVFDPRVGRSLLSHLTSAINGAAVARGTSFLKDRLGQMVFAKGIDIIDDPHRLRGQRSKPCDAEGLPTRPRKWIEDGRLTSWIMDLRSARQLGLASTGHAARSAGGPPSPAPSNLYLAAGKISKAALLADIDQGFYVTEMFGMGVNGITGDYSRGAAGFWIEKGALTFPVSEVTLAGNLKEMFSHLTPADDLELKHSADVPTLRIDGLTLAGS